MKPAAGPDPFAGPFTIQPDAEGEERGDVHMLGGIPHELLISKGLKEITDWHRISVTNDAIIKRIQKYVKKGSKLYIEGASKTRKYKDKDGVEKYTTEVVLRPYNGELKILSYPDGKAAPAEADEGDSTVEAYQPE